MGRKNPDERTVKPAGKPVSACRTGPTIHETQAEWRLSELAGQELRFGERPAMDQNRRP